MNPEVQLVVTLAVISLIVIWLERNHARNHKALAEFALTVRFVVAWPVRFLVVWICLQAGLFDE